MNSTGLLNATEGILTDVNTTAVLLGEHRGPLQRLADPLNLQQTWTAILYILGDIYVFSALDLIVHRWFEPSITQMVDLFGLHEDVAGATLMAIGTSLPELLSGLVGVFVPGAGDTGLGTVLGSLVFNLLMITGLSIIVFPEAHITLNKVATVRDVTCQLAVIGVLVWAFSDKQVDISNVIVFLLLYVFYILVCWKSKDMSHAAGCDESDHNSETGSSDEEHALDGHATNSHSLENAKTLMALPETTPQSIVVFIVKIPLIILEAICHITIPDCRSNWWKKRCSKTGLFLCTSACIVWIAILVFFMIEWAVKAGHLLGVTPSIMGLTFCAAGTSVPDCMCSMIVARQGKGNMAISNVFGSNVFDILIAMAVPWALRYQVVGTKTLIKMEADGFSTAVFILALVMIFYVACVAIGKFKLPRPVGYLHVGLYGVFIIYVFVSQLLVFKVNNEVG
eukprot:CAMPEP_0172687990 /NCGR_PEP_ID=MMETSP1074-20121228/22091_1 /TAXON_ID=2916 /ORGANISM="Ceratium fusus, Strain PA161109" /LENGTH=451 /DNA_ID=CAMNT_0013507537 /DNA_START=101 /DNA_END=1456 /DNA_ORIENTATION=-